MQNVEEEEISFYEAAHLYDVEERRRLQCGYEGKTRRYELRSDVADLLFNARIGEVVGPFKSSDEVYELFLVDDFISFEPLSEVYEDVISDLFQAWLQTSVTGYISQPPPSVDPESP